MAAVFVLASGAAAQESNGGRAAVVVELFTSEGCSSCPPADKILRLLHEKQPIDGVEVIALGEHVDYWNRMGWEDPFSSAQFTERQQVYSAGWPLRLYTPQMVIDGTVERLGGDGPAVVEAIRAAKNSPKAAVSLTLEGDAAVVRVGKLPRKKRARVWLAWVVDDVSSEVARGENKGLTLEHIGVVRRLEEIGEIDDRSATPFETTVPLEPTADGPATRLAAFVQEVDSRRIVGATQATR